MAMGRPKAVLALDAELREQLENLAGSRSLPAGLVRRARIILLCASGKTKLEVAGQLETSDVTVGLWRRRFLAHGLSGLYDELRPGRPDQRRARGTINSQDAEEQTQDRHALEYPGNCCGDRSVEIVGLYLNPPENAVVLCVDEKSGIQALERTQPMLPLCLGYVEGVTHDYRRHGTTTLFAALDTANGKVLTRCRPRHRHQEYLGFLREIEKNVPTNLDVHIIVDNYATHKHLRVRRWFAVRPRFHMHFTPTYASWINQVEIWFNRITQQAIRRGTFGSVKELVAKIDQYVKNSNRRSQPFVWTDIKRVA